MQDCKGNEIKVGDVLFNEGTAPGIVTALQPALDNLNVNAISVGQDTLPAGNSAYNALMVTNTGDGVITHTYLQHHVFTASECEVIATCDGRELNRPKAAGDAPGIPTAAESGDIHDQSAGTATTAAPIAGEGHDGNGSPTEEMPMTAGAGAAQPGDTVTEPPAPAEPEADVGAVTPL